MGAVMFVGSTAHLKADQERSATVVKKTTEAASAI
jgi:hypothetical protein